CQRNSIVFGKISGEDKSVSTAVCHDWIQKVWPTLRTGYTDEQIFNADETGQPPLYTCLY
ncbi:hypothetical protein ACUWCL_29300, partial [Klebsiella pneumoniae]|uniref:hypothetical protein n=1 Tax=Klebsiella pneumoniae TaxID=573 RepID=UPI0040556C5D